MGQLTKVNGVKESIMDMESTRHKKELSTKGIGLKGNMTASVLSHGLMEANIKVNGVIAGRTGKASLLEKMGQYTKAIGLMESTVGGVSCKRRTGKYSPEIFRTGNF